ncbi:MAG: hypothetical protein AMXMBFR34_13460 [Myxococcaceae bacterium]
MGVRQLDLPAIDNLGRVYAPFDVGGRLEVRQSANSGADWFPVATLPAGRGLTSFAIEPWKSTLVVGAGSDGGVNLVEWRALVVVALDGGVPVPVPVAPLSTAAAAHPWATTTNGSLVAFWAVGSSGVVLRVLDVGSGQVHTLGEPVSANELGPVPELRWVE